MFSRTSRKSLKRRVLVHGLPYFGEMFANLMDGDGWEFRYYADSGVRNFAAMARDLASCDIAYQIGGRVTVGKFLRVAKALKKTRIVMHWVGSDTLGERADVAEGRAEPWVTESFHHWAECDWMVREVNALGISCELVPLPSALVPDRPSPLPAEFSVLVYVPDVRRGKLYGLDRIIQVAEELPHIRFELVGLRYGTISDVRSNLRVHGRIPNLLKFYGRTSVVWRPVRHDGLSFMVMEALGHGRHVLWTYAFPGCVQVNCASDAREQICRLYALHQERRLQVNWAGALAMAQGGYLPQRLRTEIHGRLEQIIES